jgi:rhodanese-related sulfurtransferase/DNA-binding transcriptional ArsR family regulator
MPSDARNRAFKDRLYGEFARVGKAVANPYRLEILELLAQSERTVESLAAELGVSVANASQHLQALRLGGLVERRKKGLYVHYRLTHPSVYELTKALRVVAEHQLAEVERAVRGYFGDRSEADAVGMSELLERARSGQVIIVDTRPAHEFVSGHIAGAISIPIDDLNEQLPKLPRRKEFVAYCRGPYCAYADRAVDLLQGSGRRARRLVGGFPEWRAAGLPVATGDAT